MKTCKNLLLSGLLASVLLSATACDYNEAILGTLIGAAGGGLTGQAIGRSPEATLIGVAVGSLFGYIVGDQMDTYDRKAVNYVLQQPPTQSPFNWQNPQTGSYYEMQAGPEFYTQNKQKCRLTQITANVAGEGLRQIDGISCFNRVRQTWELADGNPNQYGNQYRGQYRQQYPAPGPQYGPQRRGW